MTAYSPAPAWTQFEVLTPYGTNRYKIATVPYANIFGTVTAPLEMDLRGGAVGVPWTTFVQDFMEYYAGLWPANCTVVSATAYWQPDPNVLPIIVGSMTLSEVGTQTLPSFSNAQQKAVQKTFSFRCEDGSIFKIVALNCNAITFDKTAASGLQAQYSGLVAYVTNEFGAFASRKGGRPVALRQITTTVNEKLRRKLGMD